MTPDQIRQIAEEYAYRNNSNPNPPYCPEGELTKRLTEAFMAGAQYIAERYCIVERSKVVEWWHDIVKCYLNHNHATFDGLNEMFTDLFGKEMFNQN